MCMGELSTETNGIEMAVVGFGVATIFATVEKNVDRFNSQIYPLFLPVLT